jgi:membrane protein
LLLGASGVFLELEDALNAIWQAKAPEGLAGMARARIASLGLVIALGFLLIVSLVIDAGLKALSSFLPFGASVMLALSIAVSVAMLTMLFAAIFKFLPATPVAWENVKFGAVVTALLFEAGKFLIGTYLGSNAAISSLGAAGALLALLFWVYYSSQIFLFGAALTKARAEALGSPEEDAQRGFLPGTPMLDPSLRKEGDAPSLVSVIVLVLVCAVAFRILERLDPKEH